MATVRVTPRRGPLAAILGCVLLLAGASTAAAAEDPSQEHEIKAAFLFHFAQFVEWPPRAFPGRAAPLAFCVLGEDPFGPALDATVRGETIRGRAVTVRRTSDLEALGSCQIVFVSRSERGRLAEVLAALRSRPVLTVSEIDRFAQRGGTIGFYLDAQRVRFAINPAAARRAGLDLSSQLLRLGRLVEDDVPEDER